MSRDFSKPGPARFWATDRASDREAESNGTSGGAAKTVIVLFDTSLSMQWEKLERSYQALETLLRYAAGRPTTSAWCSSTLKLRLCR